MTWNCSAAADPATRTAIDANALIVLYRLPSIPHAEARRVLPMRQIGPYRGSYSLKHHQP